MKLEKLILMIDLKIVMVSWDTNKNLMEMESRLFITIMKLGKVNPKWSLNQRLIIVGMVNLPWKISVMKIFQLNGMHW